MQYLVWLDVLLLVVFIPFFQFIFFRVLGRCFSVHFEDDRRSDCFIGRVYALHLDIELPVVAKVVKVCHACSGLERQLTASNQ